MSTIVNLMYYPAEDIFYFTDAAKVDPRYQSDFVEFIGEVMDGINIPSEIPNIGLEYQADETVQEVNIGALGDPIGFFIRETGEGAFPFHQSMRLTNIPANQVLTSYDAGTTYNFEFEVQGNDYNFSRTGAQLITYQDIMDAILSETPATALYFSTTADGTPYIEVKSNFAAVGATTGGGGGGGTTIAQASRIKCDRFANTILTNVDDDTTTDGSYARIVIDLPEPVASEILTLVPLNDSTVFSFAIGKAKGLSVRGFQSRTYQDLVDTIGLFDGVSCLYRMDGEFKHTIFIYSAVPKSPKIGEITTSETETDAPTIKRAAILRSSLMSYIGSNRYIQVEDFSPLTQNSKIVHILGNSVSGGYTMMDVLMNSKRSNGSYWTEIAAIENDRKTANDVSSMVPEHKSLLEAIDADTTISKEEKRKASLSLGKIIALGGSILAGVESAKNDFFAAAIGAISGLFTTHYAPDASVTYNPSDVDPIQDEAIDTGSSSSAIDPISGDVLDESLLTPAQRSKLIPTPRTTVD